MKILYLGDDFVHSTSAHRAAALRRLGHEVTVIYPLAVLSRSPVVGAISTRLGFSPFVPWIDAAMRRKIAGQAFDLAWIDSGADVSPGFHRWLRDRKTRILNYNIDDPFGTRDGRKWDLYRRSVPYHDVTVVVRNENVPEAQAVGASNVIRVYRSYDPVAHAPKKLTDSEKEKWRSDVVFVGAWMPERGPFLSRLLELGVPLSIWGHSWHRAKEWSRLRACWRGSALHGDDYVNAINGAKVALGLLSKGNRDLHTTRSAEVPFIGGAVFCAERTEEHSYLFKEGKEAAFWSDEEECASRCIELLADAPLRRQMAEAARRRIVAHRLSNDEVLAAVILQTNPQLEQQPVPVVFDQAKSYVRPFRPQSQHV